MYKTFDELEVGDYLYFVEISQVEAKIYKNRIKNIWKTDYDFYIVCENDPSRLFFDTEVLTQTSKYGCIFTTEEEATSSGKLQITNVINILKERIKYFENFKIEF